MSCLGNFFSCKNFVPFPEFSEEREEDNPGNLKRDHAKKKAMDIPENVQWKDCEEFFPDIREGRCIKVYDIDSPTLAVRIGEDNRLYRISLRLDGIDSPEIKSKNPKEKETAIRGKKALEDKILGKMVRVEISNKKDKFGRLLCKIFHEEVCINDWAISEGYAQAYSGKTKSKFNL